MDDPGLDQPISDGAKDVEDPIENEKQEREEDEEEFLEPSRWWFASTAAPLIAGTFGPMASAFSICALVVHWRVFIPPGGAAEENGIPIPDPKWLIGINAAQLAIALISNLFLLMNMAGAVRFSLAQPITIIGWYLSAFTLIGLTACASGPLLLEPRISHAFTQAYYYAVFAAGLYFLVATLMAVTVYGAYRGHYDREFQLSMSQRTLMLQTISFMVYLLCGAAVYSHIEGWAYLDAVYWADFTLLTVGIGDYAPSTHLGRGLLFPFAIGGIIILGLVIGSIRSLVLERGKVKMGARMVEKERQRLIKKVEKNNNGELLKPVTDDKQAPMSRASTRENPDGLTERERRRKEFDMMRQIQEYAAIKRRWTSLVVSATTWFALWFVGAAIFQQAEYGQNWSYFGSLYFSYTSLLTIGYGDFYPQSNSGKPFFVFWSLLAVPSLTILISNMGDTVIKMIRDLTLWVGTFTVMPDEKGVKTHLKESVNKVTRGRIFSDEVEAPPGLLGEKAKRAKRTRKEEEEEKARRRKDPESGDTVQRETKGAEEHGEDDDALPESKHHFHLILAQEIGKVLQHLNSSPPRQYSFEEWAWYLKLLGENEGDADTHRKPLMNPKADGEGLGTAVMDKDKKAKWSWVGNRSPLMGNKAESEWVLERLTKRLERSLEKRRQESEGSHESSRTIAEREPEEIWDCLKL